MKLRTDLLAHLTAADVLEESTANQHRYKAEPTFSKTGRGHLSPASTDERAKEVEHSIELTRKLTQRLKQNGNKDASPS